VLFFSNDHTVWVSRRYSVETMEAVPADLQPPQLIYIMLMCLRALAVQSGVFVSPTDMCWEQANPSGTHGPVGCTIGDGSNLGSALGCTEVSDSDSSPKETKAEGVGKTQGPRKKRSPRSRLFHLREDGNAHPAPIMIARGRRRVRSNELQITGVSNFHWFFQKKIIIIKVEFKLCVTPWKP